VPDGSTTNEGRRWPGLLLAGGVLLALVASAAWYGLSFGWINLFIEGSWIELVQLFTWLAGACWAWWRVPRTAPGRDRWMIFWLAVILSIAAGREQDLQKYMNPQRFGELGVSFRIAWWLDASVPLALKLGWVVVGGLAAAALTVPLLRARPRLVLLTLGLDPSAWLFGVGGFFLMLGYGADDLFGRGLIMSTKASEVLEESSELAGVALVVASAAVTGRGRLDGREARAGRVRAQLSLRGRGLDH
jgi:hypothetical protein